MYIMGMIAPVHSDTRDAYFDYAKTAAAIFLRNGAMSVIEGWGDDIPVGKVNDMKMAVALKDSETPVFSWIVWPSKEAKDAGMKASFEDPFFSESFYPGMDGARMIFGGFEPIVSCGPLSGFGAYMDGFLVPCPADNREAYRKMAEDAWPFFQKFGATSLYECWGDEVPDGKLTSMPLAVRKQPDETVLFSWVGWPSREARLRGQEAMMKDPDMKPPEVMPFDGMRMIYGGFEVIVDR